MAGTNAKAAKKALFDLLATAVANPASALYKVNVDYGYRGKRDLREYIYGGRIVSAQHYPNMTSGTKPRDEQLTIDVHIDVVIPGGDQVDADDRATQLGGAMEVLIAQDVTLGGTVPGLRWYGVTGFDMVPSFDDDAVYCEMTYHLLFSSRLF